MGQFSSIFLSLQVPISVGRSALRSSNPGGSARGVCKVLDALISISTMDNIGIHVLVHPEFHVLLFQYQPWLILNFISLFIRPCIVLDVLISILTMVNIEIPFH